MCHVLDSEREENKKGEGEGNNWHVIGSQCPRRDGLCWCVCVCVRVVVLSGEQSPRRARAAPQRSAASGPLTSAAQADGNSIRGINTA